ncbi:MAG TPA: M56 family metallopeptidase [Acidobacteriaceae bacterium]
MSPDLLLGVTAALAGFILKITVAFGICWILTRLIVPPAGKFLAWLIFLSGAAAYWLFLIMSFLWKASFGAEAQHGPAAVSPVGAWHVPEGWMLPLTMGIQTLAGLYLLALAYFLIGYLRKQLHLRWVLRFAIPPPAGIAETFRGLADSLSPRQSRLLVLSGITSPATVGWLRPTVLLPADCINQNPSELEDVLRHELHHIRRRDFAANALAALSRALIFFHPAVWYAMHKMQLERELACDLAVVSAFPERRARYAESLVRFARLNLAADTEPWGLDFAASSAHLKTRVHSVLRESRRLSRWLVGMRTGCGVVLVAGFVVGAPSLAIVLSYAHHRYTQDHGSRGVLPLADTGSRTSSRLRAKRKRQTGAEAVPAHMDVPQTNERESLQILQPDPNFKIRGEAPGSLSGSSSAVDTSESEASNKSSGSNGPLNPPGRAKFPGPTLTSVILDTVREIAISPDNEHDHH